MVRSLLILGALAVSSCSHQNGPEQEQKKTLGRGTVVLLTKGRTVRVDVDVARTPEQITRGLMFRKKLGAHEGMLFIFEHEKVQSFWMKNTYIPLDMVFINHEMRVVGIVENAEPMTTTSRRVDAPSTYVLEVRGGFSKAQGISTETSVRFELN
jgi:uncharacterized membrane protein (UPF0127 family)